MTIDEFNNKNGHTQRYGFTTGTTATAAALGAVYLYLQKEKQTVDVELPYGITLSIPIEYSKVENDEYICCVRKYAGDDPDVTDGILISSKLKFIKGDKLEFRFFAGEGVGTFTKDGLALPKGEPAINPVPRQMMIDNISKVLLANNLIAKVNITIMVENGIEVAKKTFNERLGVIGGISILGTSGMVLPMSKTALLETIEADIKFRIQNSDTNTVSKVAIISNFIGESIDYAISNDAKNIVLCGDMGKLIKLSGGIMNTHSNDSDSRLELLLAAVIKEVLQNNVMEFSLLAPILLDILKQKTTTAAVSIIKEYKLEKCFDIIANKMLYYAYNRAFKAEIFYHKNKSASIDEFKEKLQIRIIVFSDNETVIDTGEKCG